MYKLARKAGLDLRLIGRTRIVLREGAEVFRGEDEEVELWVAREFVRQGGFDPGEWPAEELKGLTFDPNYMGV